MILYAIRYRFYSLLKRAFWVQHPRTLDEYFAVHPFQRRRAKWLKGCLERWFGFPVGMYLEYDRECDEPPELIAAIRCSTESERLELDQRVAEVRVWMEMQHWWPSFSPLIVAEVDPIEALSHLFDEETQRVIEVLDEAENNFLRLSPACLRKGNTK